MIILSAKTDKMATNNDEAELRKNPILEFHCCGTTFKSTAFTEHLSKEHGLNADKISGTQQMMSHIDGSYWYSYTYKWKLDTGLEFIQYSKQARSKSSPMF